VDWTVVVDNSGGAETFEADDVWRIGQNLGCPVRWLPALMLHRFSHVAFFDDDCIPKTPPVGLSDTQAVVGYDGRKLRGGKYVYGRVSGPVDVVVRNCVFRRKLIVHALQLRDALAPKVGDLVDVHDDIMLNCAAQTVTRQQSYVVGSSLQDLPTGAESLHRKPGHLAARQRMIDACKELGWQSLC
jgi:hypothetical protein